MEKPTILQLTDYFSIMLSHFKAVAVVMKPDRYNVVVYGTEGFEYLVFSTIILKDAKDEKERIETIVYESTKGRGCFSPIST